MSIPILYYKIICDLRVPIQKFCQAQHTRVPHLPTLKPTKKTNTANGNSCRA